MTSDHNHGGSGSEWPPDFAELSQAEQAAAVRRLAAAGLPDERITAATGMSLELVRRAIAARMEQFS
jgi:hypothetical protein